MIVHSTVFDTAVSAAHRAGLSSDRIVLLDNHSSVNNVRQLIEVGSMQPHMIVVKEPHVIDGNKKIAFLCWSSGTTGRPKVLRS